MRPSTIQYYSENGTRESVAPDMPILRSDLRQNNEHAFFHPLEHLLRMVRMVGPSYETILSYTISSI